MAKVGKYIVIGCTDRTVRRYTLKGRRTATMPQPANITALASMEYEPKQYSCALVALDNRTVSCVYSTRKFAKYVLVCNNTDENLPFLCLALQTEAFCRAAIG